MSNPLTPEQQRRLDAWIAEKLFGYVRALYPYAGGEQVWLVRPEVMVSIPGLKPTTQDVTHLMREDIPRFTDTSSPRQLLDEARTRCIEKVGEARWYAFLKDVIVEKVGTRLSDNVIDAATWDVEMGLVTAEPVDLCKSFVLALDGNLEEIVNGK